MPNALLARYFQQRGLLKGLDFSSMKEGRPDALFAAWLELPEEERHTLDAEIREVFEMACEKGVRAIIDELHWQLRVGPDALAERIAELAALPNHYHRAILTYLDHRECWKGASRFYHADTLPLWRKRKNMGSNACYPGQRWGTRWTLPVS